MLTKNGVCYDLKNTPFILELKKYNLKLCFSSKFYLEGFQEKLSETQYKLEKSLNNRFDFDFNAEQLVIMQLYINTEKRGFRVLHNEKEITKFRFVISSIYETL